MRNELRHGGYDVVHVHEPVAPDRRLGRRCSSTAVAPLVGTFHCYSDQRVSNGIANALARAGA